MYLEINEEEITRFLTTTRVTNADWYTGISDVWYQHRKKRDGDNYHITILLPNEIKENKITEFPEDIKYSILGIDSGKFSVYLVVDYPAGDRLRKKYGLPAQDFHITIGFGGKDERNQKILTRKALLNHDGILTALMVRSHPYHAKWRRFVEYMFEWYTTNLPYTSETPYPVPSDTEQILIIYHKIILLYKEFVSGRKDTSDEILALTNLFVESEPVLYVSILLRIEDKLINLDTSGIYELIPGIEKKEIFADAYEFIIKRLNEKHKKRFYTSVDNRILELKKPHNLTEIYDSGVFGSGLVNSSHRPFIIASGFDAIISLMEEPSSLKDDKEIAYHHFPIPDRKTTDEKRVHTIIDTIHEYKKVIVHCRGGKGRTAMIIAAYFMKYHDRVLDEILPYLDRTRETILAREQKGFLIEFEKSLRASRNDKPVIQPSIRWMNHKSPKVIMLVGLPASGKSTLTDHITSELGNNIIRVNQDDHGLKKAKEVFSDNLKNRKIIIIDRCNIDPEQREYWLKNSNGQKIWCIHLDYDPEYCIDKAEHRENHPTLKPESARKIITGISKKQIVPTEREGFEVVIRIENPTELNSLLESWQLSGINLEETTIASENPVTGFFKFPRTRHFLNLGSATRDDLLMTEKEKLAFVGKKVNIEEKIDGANLGISIDPKTFEIRVQNRSHYVSSKSHQQFGKLNLWITNHSSELFEILRPGLDILFGEWMVMRHSIHYTHLPDYFIAFDLFRKDEKKFISRTRLDEILIDTSIEMVPLLASHRFESLEKIYKYWEGDSAYTKTPREGVYIKMVDDDDEYTVARGKIVRNDFISGNKSWDKGILIPNTILY